MVAWAGSRFPPAHDGVRYDALAARLAAGLGYTWLWPDGTVTTVAHYPVGYPAALALAYRLLGHSPFVAGLENALLGALAALAAHALASRVASPRVALAAGLAIALHSGLVLYTAGIMTEGITTTLVAVGAWIAVASAGRSAPWRLVVLGLVMGAAGLVRPQALLLAPMFGWLAAGRRGALIAVGIAAATCAPWVVRNCLAVGRCTLSTNTGWNLLIGAQPGATGAWQTVTVSGACKDVFGEATTDACFGREAVRDILAAPGHWLALAPRKLGATFDLAGIGGYYLNLSNPSAFSWNAVLGAGAIETLLERTSFALALVGAWQVDGPRRTARGWLAGVGVACAFSPVGWVAVVLLCVALACLGVEGIRRHPVHAATFMVMASTAAVHAVFFGAPRYALVTVPFVTTLAVMAVPELRTLRTRRPAG